MTCLFCRRNIGLLRSYGDANFCCAEHRNKYRANSARALREAEDLYGADGDLGESRRTRAHAATPASSSIASSVALVTIPAAFLLFAMTRGSGDGPAPPRPPREHASSPSASVLQRGIGQAIERAPVTIRETFASGLSKWKGPLDGKAAGWSFGEGYARPGKLRVWTDSQTLSNYELEFVGRVEKKSMDWAFRAADFKNYYVTKLTVAAVSKSNPLPNAGLVRYAVIDGRERDRVEAPLPIALDRNTDYRVKVSVRGNRFLTSIDGQLVSSWSDNRISRGGVGLFSDLGESAAFKWLSVSERDSFWGRLASHFSIIVFPAPPPAFTR